LAKILGTSTKARVPAAPDVPSLSEVGLPDFNAIAWICVVAPAKTPSYIVQKLHTELTEVKKSSDYLEFLRKQGSLVMDDLSTDEMTGFFKSEIAMWGETLRGAGLVGIQ
jgi:tripartite-type tricarboxylate transporter receptor subunit TctC